MGTTTERLPADVTELPLSDVQELIDNKKALVGLRAILPEVSAQHDFSIHTVNRNIETVAQLKIDLEKLRSLEDEVRILKEKELTLKRDWTQSESQMHLKSRPYTGFGVEEALRREISHLESYSKKLENYLDSDPMGTPKKYVETRKLYHYKKDMLNSL